MGRFLVLASLPEEGKFVSLLRVLQLRVLHPLYCTQATCETYHIVQTTHLHVTLTVNVHCREYLPLFFKNKEFARVQDDRTPLQLLSQLIADLCEYASSRLVLYANLKKLSVKCNFKK